MNKRIFFQVLKNEGIPLPIAEYRFEPSRKWRVDFYFEANGVRLALEVEGGVWLSGRHNRPEGFLRDMEKYNALTAAGIFLYRVTPGDLCKHKTIKNIKNILKL